MLVTVADIYDALTTRRSYRPGFSHLEALEITDSEMGRTLDPSLFVLFRERVAPGLTGPPAAKPRRFASRRPTRVAIASPIPAAVGHDARGRPHSRLTSWHRPVD